MKRDPFEILALNANATKRDIKKSHRVLSKRFHPDLNPNDPGAAAQFKEVQWAYETLCGKKSAAGAIDGTGSTMAAPPDPTVWSEKPCVGFFSALRAYCERIPPQNRRKAARDDEDPSSGRKG
jgi:hypothetical protein